MSKRTNWQDFKEVLDQHNIHTLYHLTDRDNLKDIIKNGGLYSWKDCLDKGSELTELENVVDSVFTTMSDKVDNFAKNAVIPAPANVNAGPSLLSKLKKSANKS